MQQTERLHKLLARAGVASRRACEDLIRAGRVRVNGQIADEVGIRVDPNHDQVLVDGHAIALPQQPVYLLLNKPVGVVSTAHDPWGRPTVIDLVDASVRVFPVGRLDANSQGLLLLTNDGELTHHLTHPRFEIEKEYHALLDRVPTTRTLRMWREGVMMEEHRTAPAQVDMLDAADVVHGGDTENADNDGTWLRIVLREGRKRQIREVAKLLGHTVKQLIRVREGSLHLGNLSPGAWRELRPDEVQQLRVHLHANAEKSTEG